MGATFSNRRPQHRVYCISDLHTDHRENLETVKTWRNMPELYSKNDTLIVAGDISQHLSAIEETFKVLLEIFGSVFFVPGNNELRLPKSKKTRDYPGNQNSIMKFEEVIDLCQRLGVHTQPRDIYNGRVRIVPLFGWYTPFFEPSFSGDDSYTRGWLDFRRVHWPRSFRAACNGEVVGESKVSITPGHVAARHFAERNEGNIPTAFRCSDKQPASYSKRGNAGGKRTVISFSHFLPRRDLLPRLAVMRKSSIQFVVGDPQIDTQLRSVNSTIHVFGHTHIASDNVIDGVRYVQNPAKHPGERMFGDFAPKCVLKTPILDAMQEEQSRSSSSSERVNNEDML